MLDYYKDKYARELCHMLKGEDKNTAIPVIAKHLSSLLPSHSLIIPAPQHTGQADYTLEIAKLLCAPICDCLRCTPHSSLYKQKKSGEATINLYLTESVHTNKRLLFLDNVISTGITFSAANKLFNGKLFPFSYAIDTSRSFYKQLSALYI